MEHRNATTSACGSTSACMQSSERIQLRMDVNDPYNGIEGISEEEGMNEEEDIPVVDSKGTLGKPFVGQQFSSVDEAYNFYNAYAGRIGFSVRKASQHKTKFGLSSARFTCSKEGKSKQQKKSEMLIGSVPTDKSPAKLKPITRVGCKASCRVRLMKGGIWQLSVFEENHNHPLVTSPSKKRNLRSQRCISQEDIEIIHELSAQGVETSKIYEYISGQHGGRENIRMRKKDISNRISKKNRQLVGCDVETTLVYFRKKQEIDPEFFFAIDSDDDGLVRNMFWVDGRGRRAYQEFGDVVTFDTTYNTNKYSMPLAPFIGVNHHRHSIFFGLALLRSEDAKNFVWLFTTWLVAMYDKHPTAIITDQDPAMKKAIEEVFPQTVHRCCQWHVMRKAREHLGVIYRQKSGFMEELGAVINRSLSEQEFMDNWVAMTDRYELTSNKHLKVMFDKRREWVPVFFRSTFFADMSTTQRSESMNAILKLG